MTTTVTTYNSAMELVLILGQCTVYLYPGVITYSIHSFFTVRDANRYKISIVKCIVISFLYLQFYIRIFKQQPINFSLSQHIILVITSIVLPIGWCCLRKMKWVEYIRKSIGEPEDTKNTGE